ncbi:UDP-N-acetylmuramate dehydrogenase [Alteromonas sp. A081]|uniref:UDP-N-acetylmuramate dehydrogenase n=1 Tax=Alteromonas sp. A081 TaxID=3410269 RepID=UPI003B97F4D2
MPSLQQYSTFGLNTSCTSIHSFSDIDSFFRLYKDTDVCYLLGGGSNSIFTETFEGTVLVNEIKGVSHFDDENSHFLRVGAGESWHELVKLCMQNEWFGFENLALIPGSVGASPIQNIGAYGVEVNTLIDTVEAVVLSTGEKILLKNEDCQFDYRDSIFKHGLADKVLITHVNFVLPKVYDLNTAYGELAALRDPTPQDIYNKVIDVRKAKLPDPKVLGNAGSFFKNPIVSMDSYHILAEQYENVPHFIVKTNTDIASVKVPAAWLIDQVGFKGKTLNGIRCHPTQPLVLTNLGDAKGSDVLSMAKDIIASVYDRFNIKLEPEVRLLGSKGLISL